MHQYRCTSESNSASCVVPQCKHLHKNENADNLNKNLNMLFQYSWCWNNRYKLCCYPMWCKYELNRIVAVNNVQCPKWLIYCLVSSPDLRKQPSSKDINLGQHAIVHADHALSDRSRSTLITTAKQRTFQRINSQKFDYQLAGTVIQQTNNIGQLLINWDILHP